MHSYDYFSSFKSENSFKEIVFKEIANLIDFQKCSYTNGRIDMYIYLNFKVKYRVDKKKLVFTFPKIIVTPVFCVRVDRGLV